MIAGPGVSRTYPEKINGQLLAKLAATAKPGCWWRHSISHMTEMVIQLLAREQMKHDEIAIFIDCPVACVELIASHYAETIARTRRKYRALFRR